MQNVEETGVNALAISVGNLHGIYRGVPRFDYERISWIHRKVSAALVLHGDSGLSRENIQSAVMAGIRKLNVYTELSKTAMDHTKNALEFSSEWLEVSKSLRETLKECIKKYIVNIKTM